MPTKGQKLITNATGDTYEFLSTADDTNGEHVSLLTNLVAKGKIVPNHFHLFQDETFEEVSGKLTIWLNGETFELGKGERVHLLKNQHHNHYNNSDETVTYIHTVSPALDFGYLVENLVGLASDGKSKNGNYGLVQELVTLKYLDSKAYLADIPLGIQKVLMAIIAPLGRLAGYRAVYLKYSGIEK